MATMPARFLRSTAVVAALLVPTKLSGLLRAIVVAGYFGTSREMDAFIVAATILGLALAWLEKPVRVVVVPFVTQILREQGDGGVWRQTSRLLNGALVLFVVAALGQAALAPLVVGLVAPGLDDAGALAGRLARFLALALVLEGLSRFLSAVSHAHQRFARPGLTTTVEHLVTILAVVTLAPAFGIWSLATGTVVGALASALVLLPVVWAHRRDYRSGVDLGDPALRRLAWLGLPLMIGSGGAQIGQLTDRFFASLLPAGRLSAMAYAYQLTYAPLKLVATPLITVLFPFLAHAASANDPRQLSRKLGRSLNLLFIAVVPISVAIGVLHEPLVRLVYERGAFGGESTQVTGQTVLYYALGLPAFALSVVMSYAFYSVQDTRTPVLVGLARLGVKLLLSVTLVRPLAHVGLALAESLSSCVKAVLLLALLPDALRGGEYRRTVRSLSMTAAAGAGMALVLVAAVPAVEAVFAMDAAAGASVPEVATVAALGGAAYLALSMLFQPVEVRDLYRILRAGLQRRG
jgi:putative peptidoglycan lipid II flippase